MGDTSVVVKTLGWQLNANRVHQNKWDWRLMIPEIDNLFKLDKWFKKTDQRAQDRVQSMEYWPVLDINNRLKREKLKAPDPI